VRASRLLAPWLARLQHIQGHLRDGRRQPAAQVLDIAGVGAAEPEPGFLNGILGFAQRAEDPDRRRPQAGSVLLESVGQPASRDRPSVTFLRRELSYQ
jgi:hypothetical protein